MIFFKGSYLLIFLFDREMVLCISFKLTIYDFTMVRYIFDKTFWNTTAQANKLDWENDAKSLETFPNTLEAGRRNDWKKRNSFYQWASQWQIANYLTKCDVSPD